MSHQAGLGNNGVEATGLTKPDDGYDRMQKQSENVAHGRNGIQLNKLENSGHLRNSPTTRRARVFSSDTPGDRRKDAPNARQPVGGRNI